MAEEKTKLRVKAVAKVEKYDDDCTENDILMGVAIPYETVVSEDVFVDATPEQIEMFKKAGIKI